MLPELDLHRDSQGAQDLAPWTTRRPMSRKTNKWDNRQCAFPGTCPSTADLPHLAISVSKPSAPMALHARTACIGWRHRILTLVAGGGE